MSLRINTNVEAFNAHRQLVSTEMSMSKAMEKLSSGLRINRAADDAAGLAISEKMRAQIRGVAQAHRNTHGRHLDGAVRGRRPQRGARDHPARPRARRAVQQRHALDLRSRGDHRRRSRSSPPRCARIITSTQFNSINILESTTPITFQVGANAGEVIAMPGLDLGGATYNYFSSIFVNTFTAGGADINAIGAGALHGRRHPGHARRAPEPPGAHGHEPRDLPGEPVRRREPHPRHGHGEGDDELHQVPDPAEVRRLDARNSEPDAPGSPQPAAGLAGSREDSAGIASPGTSAAPRTAPPNGQDDDRQRQAPPARQPTRARNPGQSRPSHPTAADPPRRSAFSVRPPRSARAPRAARGSAATARPASTTRAAAGRRRARTRRCAAAAASTRGW